MARREKKVKKSTRKKSEEKNMKTLNEEKSMIKEKWNEAERRNKDKSIKRGQ